MSDVKDTSSNYPPENVELVRQLLGRTAFNTPDVSVYPNGVSNVLPANSLGENGALRLQQGMTPSDIVKSLLGHLGDISLQPSPLQQLMKTLKMPGVKMRVEQ